MGTFLSAGCCRMACWKGRRRRPCLLRWARSKSEWGIAMGWGTEAREPRGRRSCIAIVQSRVGSYGNFIFNSATKSEIRELFGRFLFSPGPRRALSLVILPSLGPYPSVYAVSTQSDCMKSCSKKENGRLEHFCWNMHA